MQIEKTGISLQEFATICNLIQEWNKNNPSDIIELKLDEGTTGKSAILSDIKKQIMNGKDEYKIEEFLQDAELYYFEFKSSRIGYNSDKNDPSLGRINSISMKLQKR